MKPNLFLSMGMTSVVACQSFAGTMGDLTLGNTWNWVGSISGGPVWEKAGEIQTFYLTPNIIKTYSPTKYTKTLASGELFIGLQKTLSSQSQGQLGLAASVTNEARLKGIIWDDAIPEFDNHSYSYKVMNSRVSLKGKWLLNKGYWFLPWLSGSLGVSFNYAQSFTNTPLIFEALPNSNFKNHTQTAFTYALGAGVQKVINNNWQVGVGYELADWGKSRLSRALGQTLNSGLKLNHLYTNGLLLNLTYVA